MIGQIPARLERVLRHTGYIADDRPAAGVLVGPPARSYRRAGTFQADAVWMSPSSLRVYFKYSAAPLEPRQVATWQREVWNEAFVPLLWLVGPDSLNVYNGFSAPRVADRADEHLFRTFRQVDSDLEELDAIAGRLSMETGAFWRDHGATINRKTAVDRKLLAQLGLLDRKLRASGFDRGRAQGLIGRVIFAQFLIDRGIVSTEDLVRVGGFSSLAEIMADGTAASALFAWMSEAISGDLFPTQAPDDVTNAQATSPLVDFLNGTDLATGQTTIFPYEFNLIPVDLISSIYEQFAHSKQEDADLGAGTPRDEGLHYTRLSLVSLVLDEVMTSVRGDERVLDLTCGSGVFLVEALRKAIRAIRPGLQRIAAAHPLRAAIRCRRQ